MILNNVWLFVQNSIHWIQSSLACSPQRASNLESWGHTPVSARSDAHPQKTPGNGNERCDMQLQVGDILHMIMHKSQKEVFFPSYLHQEAYHSLFQWSGNGKLRSTVIFQQRPRCRAASSCNFLRSSKCSDNKTSASLVASAALRNLGGWRRSNRLHELFNLSES